MAPKEVDDGIDQADDVNDRGEAGSEELGEAKEDLDQAEEDLEDDDQDAQDKARNVSDGGTDAMEDVGEALDDFGIGDPGLKNLAQDIDDFTEDVLGRGAPDHLPPVHYRLYFGKKEATDQLKDDLLGSAMDAGDSLVEEALGDVPVVGGFTNNAVSSFFDDDSEIDDGASDWTIAGMRLEEGVSEPFRLELLLTRTEIRSPLEGQLDARPPSEGDLYSGLTAPYEQGKALYEGAVGAAEGIADTASDTAEKIASIGDDPSAALDLAGDALGGLMPDSETPGDEQPCINIPLDPKNFLNKTVSLAITRDDLGDPYAYTKRWVTGIISELTDLGVRRPAGMPQASRLIRIVVVPSLWKLSLRKDCRVFENMTALEVVREVFRVAGVYGFLPDLPGVGALTGAVGSVAQEIPMVGGGLSDALSGQFIKTLPPEGKSEKDWTPPREYCVQYQESDLDFVRRLLEEEGITFFFGGGKGEERLILVDDPGQVDKCRTVDGRAVPYIWPDEKNAVANVETVRQLTQRVAVHHDRAQLRDFCHSDERVLGPTILGAERPRPDGPLPYYAYPARAVYRYAGDDYRDYASYTGETEGDRDLARLRLEGFVSNAYVGTLEGDVTGICPGRLVKLKRGRVYQTGDDKDKTEGSQTLLIRRVVHEARTPAASVGRLAVGRGLRRAGGEYRNRFEYSWVDTDDPSATPFRPALTTPKPRIAGLVSATVVDDGGDKDTGQRLHLDHRDRTRIKVRFHWDRRGESPVQIDIPLIDKGTSCWVRVAQPWANAEYGALFIPRIGMEVMVAFEEGDPDRPVVVGCVYNEDNPPPVGGPHESTIRTLTNPVDDDETFNELLFDDTNDAEKVKLTASRYLLEEVRSEHLTVVGHDQENLVSKCHGEIVDGRQILNVGKARFRTVEGDETIAIGGDRVRDTDGNEERTIHGKREETIVRGLSFEIGGARTLTISGVRETTIGEKKEPPFHDTLEVAGNKTDTIEKDLKVVAGSLKTGTPGGAGDGDQAGGLAVEEESAEASSEQDVKLLADGEVTITSAHADVSFASKVGWQASCGLHQVTLGGPDQDASLRLYSPDRVRVLCTNASMIFSASRLFMNIPGQPLSRLEMTPSEAKIEGGSLAVVMDGRIEWTAPAGIKMG